MEGDSGKRKVRMKKLVNDQDTTTTRATDLSRYVIAYLSNKKKNTVKKGNEKDGTGHGGMAFAHMERNRRGRLQVHHPEAFGLLRVFLSA